MLDRFPPARRTFGVLVAASAAFTLAAGPARANPVPNHDYAYEIRPLHVSGKCLEIADWRTDNAAPARLWDCTGQPNQQWRMVVDWTFQTRYAIRNVHSGKCLQIGNLARINGAAVNQWDCNGSPNQRWSRTDRNPDLIVGERFNGGPALCLDVTDWQTHNGAGVQIWDCHPAANQTWVWNIKQ
ncbi:RICIN domain-containing protein [Streptomyces sp. NPDC006656]|uniref:RICIN domain-containing protein n=1 Tax=Streptomyces sp. NPDC006656 TaxID=3156899 RepID=UPI00345502ED